MMLFKSYLIFLCVTILSWLVFTLAGFTEVEHQKRGSQFQQIENDVLILNQGMLEVHRGSLRSYDRLIIASDSIESVVLKLDTYIVDIGLLPRLLNELVLARDHFLSAQSVVNNSYAVLSVLHNELNPRTGKQQEIAFQIDQLLKTSLLYTRWYDLKYKVKMELLIDQLLLDSVFQKAEQEKSLELVFAHLTIIKEYSSRADNELEAALSIHIKNTVKEIRQQYEQVHSEKQQQTAFLKGGIFFIALSLLLTLYVNSAKTIKVR